MADKIIKLEITVNGQNEVKAVTQNIEKLGKATNKTDESISTYARNLRGAGNNAKNATGNFAKQAQGMGGLVHVYATVAANVFALSAAYDVLKKNADLSIMADAAEDLSRATGISYSAVATSMKEITGGAISFHQAMRQANLALSGGASFQQVEQITEIANKAANTLGLSVPDAVGRMIQAVTKGEPELVDELGIILRVTRATEEYAAAHGKAASELTTFEKQQAIINQLITQGNEKFADVEKQANPYAQLSANISDLSRVIIEFVSGPITGIASLFSNNIGLMIGGIGLLVASIGKKAIPLLSDIGSSANTELTKTSEAANAAAKKATDTLAILEKRQADVKVLHKTRASEGGLSSKQSGIDLKEILGKDILPKLDKRSKLGKEIAGLVASDLTEEAFSQEFRKSKIAFKLQSALNKEVEKSGSSGVFNKAAMAEKAAAATLQSDVRSASVLQRKNLQQESIEQQRQTAEIQKNTAARAENLALAKRSVAQGSVDILNAKGFWSSLKVLNTALDNVSVSYTKAAAGASFYSRATTRATVVTKQAALILTFATKAMEGLFSIISKFTMILFVFEMFKTGAQALGLLNKEFQQNSNVIQDTVSELDSAIHKYRDINKEIAKTPSTLIEATSKWTKISNVADQYATALKKIVKESEKLNQITIWDKIFSPLDTYQEAQFAAEGMQKAMKNLYATTGMQEPMQVELPKTLSKSQKREIEDLRAQTLPSNIFEGTDYKGIQDEIDKILKDPEQRRVLFLTPNIDVTTWKKLLADPIKYRAIKKAIPNFLDEALDPTKQLAVAENAIKGAISSIDSRLTKLTMKSESRRILNVDTLIGFRDDLKLTEKQLIKFRDSNRKEATLSIMPNIEGISTKALEAFVSDFSKLDTATVSVDKVSAAVNRLDQQIDTVRNFKTVIGLLSEKAKEAGERIVKGSLSAIADKYDIGTEKLEKQIGHLEVQYSITEELAKIVDKDQAANILKLDLIEAQTEALRRQYNLRTEEAKRLNISLEVLKRTKEVQDARLMQDKQIMAGIKLRTELVAKSARDQEANVGYIRDQANMSKIMSKAAERALNTRVKTLQDTIALRTEEEKRNNTEADNYKLKMMAYDLENLKLTQLKDQIKLQKALFDATNQARGQIGDTGYANSFAGSFDGEFWNATGVKFGIIANDMALKIGNSVDMMADIMVGGIQSFNTALVDSLLTDEWDNRHKEEIQRTVVNGKIVEKKIQVAGWSRTKAIIESLKETLRGSIGKSISDNMTQATVKFMNDLMTIEGQKKLTLIDQITAINASTLATQANTQALLGQSTKAGAGFFPMQSFTPSSTIPGGDLSQLPSMFATGGVVHRPTNALIGEGANSEAIVPLPDNRSIPVRLEGESKPNVNVTNTYDFRGADPASEGRLRQMAERIKRDTIREMTEQINRGGVMAKTVGRRR